VFAQGVPLFRRQLIFRTITLMTGFWIDNVELAAKGCVFDSLIDCLHQRIDIRMEVCFRQFSCLGGIHS